MNVLVKANGNCSYPTLYYISTYYQASPFSPNNQKGDRSHTMPNPKVRSPFLSESAIGLP
ncbi:MAG: hypothetical protein HC849_06255 [Oscillatoriales cyanobacterium RU_3_3]|nr:hypothetical protein [Microcoleus sp. SM1_3_4]NJM59878.1 hypothetical protein [Oscillatoriales cyanobacterium RU_3_3]